MNKKLAVFVSGTGSLFEAMLEQGLKVDLVLADRHCRGINEVAKKFNVPSVLILRNDFKVLRGETSQVEDSPLSKKSEFGGKSSKQEVFPPNSKQQFDRVRYTEKIIEVLDQNKIDLVAMAGFMTILSAPIFEKYKNRILNSHPSLLPLFKGDNAVADALASGNKVTGTTVHIATEKLDDEGNILAQEQVPILPNDTVETLHERIKQVERILYPKVIREYILKV